MEREAFGTPGVGRLRLPLNVTDAVCECGAAACPRSGRLRTRAVPTERTLARLCREAGASVRVNASRANDERTIKVLASGLPSTRGAQLVVHHTALSTHIWRSSPTRGRACGWDSSAQGRVDKETKYVELFEGNRCHFVVVGVETGNRWSSEAATVVDHFASGRVREIPSVLRRSAHLAFRRRWIILLSGNIVEILLLMGLMGGSA